jgi:toxin ParE1/3/4
LKPARLRPRAARDREIELDHYRKEAGTDVAVGLVRVSGSALDVLELEPCIGSPSLGRSLGVAGMRTSRIEGFPLHWIYFERPDHLDVVRLLGDRQELAAFLGRR